MTPWSFKRSGRMVGAALLVGLLLAGAAVAGEADWFTRVKSQGLTAACEEEVARHAKGALADSLHVGECYYHLERWEEGLRVFTVLLRSPDRNYSAAALARSGEGQYHLGRPAEAKAAFTRCLEEHPEAWLDESIPDRCRAWLAKLDGKLEAVEPDDQADVRALETEVRELSERLAELKRLLRELTGED